MRKWFIRIMVIVSIVLFVYGIYRYNIPGTSGAEDIIGTSIFCLMTILMYAYFSGNWDYKPESEIKVNFVGLDSITKENFKEKTENLNFRNFSSIHPFVIVLWIVSVLFLLSSMFAEDKEQMWFFYILVSIIFFWLGNRVRINGTIRHKCKKAIKSKGEVFIGNCYYKDKKIESYYANESRVKEYLIKVCDSNGKVLSEWVEIDKKLYNKVKKDSKLKLLVVRTSGLVKLFVVEVK